MYPKTTSFFTTTASWRRQTKARVSAHIGECHDCHAAYRRLQQVLMSVDDTALASRRSCRKASSGRCGLGSSRACSAGGGGWLSRLLPSPSRLGWAAAALVLVVGGVLRRPDVARAVDAGRRHCRSRQPRQCRRDQNQVRERHPAHRSRRSPRSIAARARRAGERGRRARRTSPASANAPSSSSRPTVSIAKRPRRPATPRSSICSTSSNACSWKSRRAPRTGRQRELDDVRRRIESGSLLFKVRVVSSDLQERRKAAVRQTGQRSSL